MRSMKIKYFREGIKSFKICSYKIKKITIKSRPMKHSRRKPKERRSSSIRCHSETI